MRYKHRTARNHVSPLALKSQTTTATCKIGSVYVSFYENPCVSQNGVKLHCSHAYSASLSSSSSKSRLPLPLRVQQPESHHASSITPQSGDFLIRQQPITRLHFHFTSDLSQPFANRGAQERQVWWKHVFWDNDFQKKSNIPEIYCPRLSVLYFQWRIWISLLFLVCSRWVQHTEKDGCTDGVDVRRNNGEHDYRITSEAGQIWAYICPQGFSAAIFNRRCQATGLSWSEGLQSLIEIRIEIQLTLDYTFNGSFLPFPNKVAVISLCDGIWFYPPPSTFLSHFVRTDTAQLFNTITVSVWYLSSTLLFYLPPASL